MIRLLSTKNAQAAHQNTLSLIKKNGTYLKKKWENLFQLWVDRFIQCLERSLLYSKDMELSMKNWSDYFDGEFIGHKRTLTKGFDFGDATQRLGMYHLGLELRHELDLYNGHLPHNTLVDFLEALRLLEIDRSGTMRRYIDIPYNDPKDWSRDQELPIIMACGLTNVGYLLKRMVRRHLRQFPFFQNKDVITWEWSYYFRALRWWWTYPLIVVMDLGLVINAGLRCLIGLWDKDNVGDDLNTSLSLIFSSKRYPTPLSWLATKIYKLRPKPFLADNKDDNNNILLAWRWYFRQPEAPPFDELFEPVIRYYF